MWIPHQRELFYLAHDMKNRGDYQRSLSIAYELLRDLKLTSLARAYVRGCIVAVDLRHLGRQTEAEQVFAESFESALGHHKAVAAYIRNDWSSMRQGNEALKMIREALVLLEEAETTPDPDRHLTADRACLRATLARAAVRSGIASELKVLRDARRLLQRFVRVLPRYRAFHFNALAWECEAGVRLRSFSLVKSVPYLLWLTVRQGKAQLLMKYVRASRKIG